MKQKTPITILTGFLGAGKTTLLNQIIKQNQDLQLAIIENEVGEISIDSDLVIGVDGDNLFELSNGCICCSSNAEFGVVINNLLHSNREIDHIVVETTGIANPSAVVESLLGDSFIMQKVELNAVICLVDANNIALHIFNTLEARQQIVLADAILLNKTDLVEEVDIVKTEETLLKLNPSAEIIRSQHAEIDTKELLSRYSFKGLAAEKSVIDFKNFVPIASQSLSHQISTFAIEEEGSLSATKFPFWLWNFLQFNGKNCYRIKGIFSYTDVGQKMLLQAVGNSHTIEPILEGKNTSTNKIQLVFICKEIDEQEVRKAILDMIDK